MSTSSSAVHVPAAASPSAPQAATAAAMHHFKVFVTITYGPTATGATTATAEVPPPRRTIRRFSAEAGATFAAFCALLEAAVLQRRPCGLSIAYKDGDGDVVEVTGEAEWQEAILCQLAGRGPIAVDATTIEHGPARPLTFLADASVTCDHAGDWGPSSSASTCASSAAYIGRDGSTYWGRDATSGGNSLHGGSSLAPTAGNSACARAGGPPLPAAATCTEVHAPIPSSGTAAADAPAPIPSSVPSSPHHSQCVRTAAAAAVSSSCATSQCFNTSPRALSVLDSSAACSPSDAATIANSSTSPQTTTTTTSDDYNDSSGDGSAATSNVAGALGAEVAANSSGEGFASEDFSPLTDAASSPAMEEKAEKAADEEEAEEGVAAGATPLSVAIASSAFGAAATSDDALVMTDVHVSGEALGALGGDVNAAVDNATSTAAGPIAETSTNGAAAEVPAPATTTAAAEAHGSNAAPVASSAGLPPLSFPAAAAPIRRDVGAAAPTPSHAAPFAWLSEALPPPPRAVLQWLWGGHTSSYPANAQRSGAAGEGNGGIPHYANIRRVRGALTPRDALRGRRHRASSSAAAAHSAQQRYLRTTGRTLQEDALRVAAVCPAAPMAAVEAALTAHDGRVYAAANALLDSYGTAAVNAADGRVGADGEDEALESESIDGNASEPDDDGSAPEEASAPAAASSSSNSGTEPTAEATATTSSPASPHHPYGAPPPGMSAPVPLLSPHAAHAHLPMRAATAFATAFSAPTYAPMVRMGGGPANGVGTRTGGHPYYMGHAPPRHRPL